MRHVAALAGVGIKTVSRVMNDEPGVSESTRLQRPRRLPAAQLPAGHGRGKPPADRAADAHRRPAAAQRLQPVQRRDPPGDGGCTRCTRDSGFRRQPGRRPPAGEGHRRRVPGPAGGRPGADADRQEPGIRHPGALPGPANGVHRPRTGRHRSRCRGDGQRSRCRYGGRPSAGPRPHRKLAYLGDRTEIQTARERRRGFIEEMGRAGLRHVSCSRPRRTS